MLQLEIPSAFFESKSKFQIPMNLHLGFAIVKLTMSMAIRVHVCSANILNVSLHDQVLFEELLYCIRVPGFDRQFLCHHSAVVDQLDDRLSSRHMFDDCREMSKLVGNAYEKFSLKVEHFDKN